MRDDGGPASGWYDDPDDPSQYRYWDGETWTAHRSAKSTSPPPSDAPAYRESRAGWALALSLAGILCCGPLSVAGLIMGVAELRSAKEGLISPSDRSVAVIAVVVGTIVTLLMVLAIAFLFAFVILAGDPAPE